MELTSRERILLVGKDLQIGFTDTKTLCPYCEGGSSHERAFNITRSDRYTVKYNCHRASCGRGGVIYLQGTGGFETQPERIFQPTPFRGEVEGLDYQDLKWLDDKYDINIEHVVRAGWGKVKTLPASLGGAGKDSTRSLVMPVFGPLGGDPRGCVVKYYSDPKEVRNYKVKDEPWVCWYRSPFKDVVVVEDQISALKAATFSTSVAMLGTGFSPEKIEEIREVAKGRVWIALDKDATKKSFELLKKYRVLFGGNLFALLLSKDLKDMSYAEIKKLGGPFSG